MYHIIDFYLLMKAVKWIVLITKFPPPKKSKNNEKFKVKQCFVVKSIRCFPSDRIKFDQIFSLFVDFEF